MGVDALRAAVEEEARTRISSVLENARQQALALCQQARSQALERRARALRDAESALRRAAAQRVAAARRTAQERVLGAREALLDRLFGRARDLLPALVDDAAARAQIAGLAEQALRHLPPGPAHIECSPGIADALEAELAGRDALIVTRDPDLEAGFRVRSGSGALVVDAVLATLLELARPQLAIEVLARLERGRS